jgi:hypothetical protein
MPDFQKLKKACIANDQISESVVDQFLINYAAEQGKLKRTMNKDFAQYRHITRHQDSSWVNMLKSQYLVHRVFQKDGLINKYINHSGLNHLTDAEKSYLRHQIEHPWRFSFSVITDKPAPDFYRMEDVFTGERFLLYSPGTSRFLKVREVSLWMNLIAFNGS